MDNERRFTVPILEPIRLTGIAAELADDAAQRSGVLDETIRRFIDQEDRIATNPHLLHRMPEFQRLVGKPTFNLPPTAQDFETAHMVADLDKQGDVLESMTRQPRFEGD